MELVTGEMKAGASSQSSKPLHENRSEKGPNMGPFFFAQPRDR